MFSCTLRSSFAFLVLFLKVVPVFTENNVTEETNGRCIQAEPEPSLNSSSCFPLNNFSKPFCEEHGIRLPDNVAKNPEDQNYRNNDLIKSVPMAQLIDKVLEKNSSKLQDNLTNLVVFVGCHIYFPYCDATTGIFEEPVACKETCLNLIDQIGKEVYEFTKKLVLADKPYYEKLLDCDLQPERNAGDSPECLYYDFKDKEFSNELKPKTDCLYINGSTYNGNISVTSSGIPCQSWTAQCPHRHTMNTTYPELNVAQNYCRNPRNSGKLPWCFTTDRKKRWEYCDVPKCIPVDGGYENWSLASSCSVLCGDGFETWRRNCTNPSPRYGGGNCSSLGNATEHRKCTGKPCPVDGGYGNWTLGSKCNVSCGKGYEIWKRYCNNPTPRNGGKICDILRNTTQYRQCTRKPCPLDGNYSNWTVVTPCTASCGKNVSIWIRKCDNPPPRYGGNCSKHGFGHESRDCHLPDCAVKWNSRKIVIVTGATAASTAFFILILILYRRKLRRNEDCQPYAILNFGKSEEQSQRLPAYGKQIHHYEEINM